MRRNSPLRLFVPHVVAFVFSWSLCVILGLWFGAWVGWLMFAVMEFRAVTARLVDTYTGGA